MRLFKNVHVSGHPYREDLREMIDLIKPQKIIPIHGDKEKVNSFKELGKEMGYDLDDKLIILKPNEFYTL